MTRRIRIIVGALLWAGGVAGLAWWANSGDDSGEVRRSGSELLRFATGERRSAKLNLEKSFPIERGDPIFLASAGGEMRQVGEVRSAADASGEMEALFYSSAPPVGRDARLVSCQTPQSMEWVIQTMLPPEKRARMIELIQQAFEEHHEEILAALRPIVLESLREAMAVVEQDLSAALARHRGEIEELGGRYQQEIVEAELIPLIKSEIWPIVQARSEPTVRRVGRELWERVSLWGFAWRYGYDKTPLVPRRDLFKHEWERYVREEAMPVLESHTDEFIEVQKQILADIARNPEVRSAVRRNLTRLIEDPELQDVVWRIVREVVVDNPRLHDVFRSHWNSEEARAALSLAGRRLEPTVREIGTLLFGDEEEISPEFARVLRSQILGKDRRWLVLEPGEGAEFPAVIRVEKGSGEALYPMSAD